LEYRKDIIEKYDRFAFLKDCVAKVPELDKNKKEPPSTNKRKQKEKEKGVDKEKEKEKDKK
jgi:hypothetical protein